MSRYDHDPRVQQRDNGYTVTAEDGTDYQVLNTHVLGWCIYYGRNLDLVPVAGGGFAVQIIDADKAIGAIIGDPVTTAAAA